MIYAGRVRLLWALLLILLVAQGAAVLAAGATAWYGWLPAASEHLEKTSIWSAPLVAAATAAMASGLRLHRAEDWARSGSRSRSELYLPALRWGSTAAATATSLLTCSVLVLCRQSATGALVVRLLVLGITLLGVGVCAAAVGVLAARHLSAWLAPLVAFVLPYVVFVALTSAAPSTPLGSVVVPSTVAQDYARIPMPSHLARAVTVSVSAALLVAGIIRPRRSRRTALLAAGSMAVTAQILTCGPVEALPGADHLTCTGRDPVVCLDSTQEATRPAYTEGARRAVALLPPSLRPARVVGSAEIRAAQAGTVLAQPALDKYLPARRISPAAVTTEVGEALFASDCPDSRIQDTSAALVAWWRLRSGASLAGGLHVSQRNFAAVPDLADEVARARSWRSLPEDQEVAAVERAAASLRPCPRQ